MKNQGLSLCCEIGFEYIHLTIEAILNVMNVFNLNSMINHCIRKTILSGNDIILCKHESSIFEDIL